MAARLTVEQYDQVASLLEQGRLTQRAIGRLMGCSRGTVAAIAAGKRKREPETRGRSSESLLEFKLGPASRCGLCGALVYGECIACHVRARLAKGPIGRAQAVGSNGCDGMGLNLPEDCQGRYEEIRYRPECVGVSNF